MISTAVVAGASGWIGTHLRAALEAGGACVRTVGRGPVLRRHLDRRPRRCARRRRSRRAVGELPLHQAHRRRDLLVPDHHHRGAGARPPSLYVNAGTGTIYRDARDRPMDEATGFAVEVARAWEHELFAAPTPVRKVALRMSIVLGPGGRMGDGGQVFSRVHVDDVARAVVHLYRSSAP